MATYKGIGYDSANARNRTGLASDTISFDGLVNITGDASVGGDLTITGDIVSRGTVDLLVADNFIDLNAGNNSTAALGGGYTIQMNRNASFAANTVTVFNAGVVGSTAAARTLTSTGVPAGNVTLFTFAYTGTNGVTVTKTITCNSGTPTDANFSAGITGFNTNETKNIARDAASTTTIGTALRSLLGSLLYYTSSGAGAACTITADNNLSDLDITIGSRDATIAESGAATGNGTAPFFTCTGGGTFASGQIAIITAADDGANDGIYLVNKKAGDNISIFGTNGFSVPTGIQFCQTVLTASTETGTECKAYQPDLYIQAVSDGSSYNLGGVAKGVLIDTYDTAAELEDYVGASSWAVVGASAADTTLQQAYDAGASITTDASGAIIFTLSTDAQGFSVQGNGAGDGNVSIGGTTNVNSFIVGASGAASSITSAGQNLSFATTTSGEIDITSAGNLDLNGVTTTIDGSSGVSIGGAGAASDFTSAGQPLTLETTTSGTLKVASAGLLDLDAAANLDIDVTGTLDILASGTMSIDSTGASNVTATSGDLTVSTATSGNLVLSAAAALDMDAAGAVTLDTTANNGIAIAAGTASTATGTTTILSSFPMLVKRVVAGASGLATGDVVYFLNDGGILEADKGDANAATTTIVAGVCINGVSAGDDAPIAIVGNCDNVTSDATFVAANHIGKPVYLSVSAVGKITPTAPTASGDTIYQVGICTGGSGTAWNVLLQPQFIMEIG